MGWLVDKQCVYYNGVKVPQADSHSVVAVLTPDHGVCTGYVKDRRHVYLMGKVIPSADAQSFRMISSACAKDQKHYYNLSGRLVSSCSFSNKG